MITTSILKDATQIREIIPDWQSLHDDFYDNPFLSPTWHQAWLKSHQPSNVRLILFRSFSQIVGILPLYYHYNILHFFSAGDHYALCPEYLDVIYEPAYADQIKNALIRYLRGKRFHFDMVRSDSLLGSALREMGHVPVKLPSYQIRDLTVSNKNYRRILKQTNYQHQTLHGKEQIKVLPELIALHEARFQDRSTIFKRPDNIEFIESLIRLNQTVTSILNVDEQRAAIFLYLKGKKQCQFYLSGISMQSSIKSPGILNHILTARALNLPIDLLAGDERYKQKLASDSSMLHNYASLGMFHKSVTILKRSVSRLLKCKGSLRKSSRLLLV